MTEFTNKNFTNFCEENGIEQKFSISYDTTNNKFNISNISNKQINENLNLNSNIENSKSKNKNHSSIKNFEGNNIKGNIIKEQLSFDKYKKNNIQKLKFN